MTTEALYQIFLQYPAVTTDTRQCRADALFFALKGASFNGNAFARQALEAGCPYAIIDDTEAAGEDERFIVVNDVLTALQDLAHYHRKRLKTPILQVTGTNGKTTTKELIAAVLGTSVRLHFTHGNLNNHIGVPLTLLSLKEEHEFAVIETGANHPGEIALLSNITAPDFGLITNVGKAHLEGFGSFEGVIKTKKELYDYLSAHGGIAFLHTDSEFLPMMAEGLTTIGYGTNEAKENLVVGRLLPTTDYLRFEWCEREKQVWHKVETRLIGNYNLPNALAAVCVGVHLGVKAEKITQALSAYTPTNNRSELVNTALNKLIVDAYNANPTSMQAALTNFAAMTHAHKLTILGEMRELGEVSAEEHRKVAEQAAAIGCEMWFVGQSFKDYAPKHALWFADVEEVKAYLSSHVQREKIILIKGSNGTRLFELPKYL